MTETVFIIDDEIETQQSLRWLVESWGYTVETYSDADSFFSAYSSARIGCLILDVLMPVTTGFELQKKLKEYQIDLPIIFISGHADIPMAIHAIKTGSIDFLTKPINKQLLLEAINKAINHHLDITHKKLKKESLVKLVNELTPREHQVMMLMTEGNPTKLIAKTLDISQHTAELHRAKVMKKMKVKTIGELVNLVVKNNILMNR